MAKEIKADILGLIKGPRLFKQTRPTAPIITEATRVFKKEIRACFIPKGPIFFLKLKNKSPVVNNAVKAVDNANPDKPMYLDRTMFKMIFRPAPKAPFIIGVTVSCSEWNALVARSLNPYPTMPIE